MNNIIKETTTTIKEFDKKGKVVRETTTTIIERQGPEKIPPHTINYTDTASNVKYGSATGKI